ALQAYTDYVSVGKDFPLSKFRSRDNAASQAVGYGKATMIWNMLRGMVGDETFVRGMQRFYRDNQFERASFDDIRVAFESVSDRKLGPFFDQWVLRTGAPELALGATGAERAGDRHRLTFTLAQKQAGEAYVLQVPVAVYSAKAVRLEKLEMTQKSQSFTLDLAEAPLRIEVDPQFELFRTLNFAEIPPSLSKAFGADKVTLVLPGDASAAEAERYRKLADIWTKDSSRDIKVIGDEELSALPADRSVWILGWNNRWRHVVDKAVGGYQGRIDDNSARLGRTEFPRAENSVVVAVRHPENPKLAVVWLSVPEIAAVEGLARKLPHYGKYSYLAFTGTEPTNIAKGEWPTVGSPLVKTLSAEPVAESVALDKRPALAQLAPVFHSDRMQSHVRHLADDAMRGRGLGSKELDAAADYIAASFKASGLLPAGDSGSYFQEFEVAKGPDGTPVMAKNVLAVLPGSNPDWKQQSVVLSAHYDHLGMGWPDPRKGNENQIHNGADDNASGVAVLLELAEVLKTSAPKRNVVFAAFSAEEAGLRGSRHYVKAMQLYPAGQAIGNVNMDTVGRLGNGKLLVLGGASASEWKFIFMGAGFVTGVETEMVSQDISASDQVAFIEAGVPGVQLFAGASPDYHQPGDDADRIDVAGLSKVAAIAREAVVYLAERPEPMHFAGAPKTAASAAAKSGERRVSTGITPDFAFAGAGMKVAEVAPDSPAHKAGLQPGDVIVAIDAATIDGLRAYSDALKRYSPGAAIEVRYKRGDAEARTSIILAER
nr:M20/M25/M40 family metallo-hydrolase [Arenimonas sp.]